MWTRGPEGRPGHADQDAALARHVSRGRALVLVAELCLVTGDRSHRRRGCGARNSLRYGAYNGLDFHAMRRFALPESTLEVFFELTTRSANSIPAAPSTRCTAAAMRSEVASLSWTVFAVRISGALPLSCHRERQ